MKPEFELTETKWSLIKELEKGPLSPKELAILTSTSIANTSQQLRLLEAQGFLKKTRNKGHQQRHERDARILYSIAKSKFLVTKISKEQVDRKDLKNHDDLLLNFLMCDLKETRHILKFFLERDDVLKKIQCLYYLQTLGNEIHFFIITNELDFFRKENHSFKVTYDNKEVLIKFWSHSFDEFKIGINKKEAYFVDLARRVVPIICDNNDIKNFISEWRK